MLKEAAVLLAFVGFQLLGDVATFISFGALTLWACLGRHHTVRALTLLAILNMLSPAIFRVTEYSVALRWVVLGAAAIRVMLDQISRSRGLPPWLLCLLMFTGVSVIGSIVASFDLSLSILSVTAFAVSFTAVQLALSHSSRLWATSWFYTCFAVLLLMSVPLVWMEDGYASNGSGFQGILTHPQTFGVVTAPVAGWLLVQLVAERHTRGVWRIGIVMVAIWMIFLSQARTALLAFGLAFAMCGAIAIGNGMRKRMYRRQAIALLVGLVVGTGAFGFAVTQSRQLREAVLGFVFKGELAMPYWDEQLSGETLVRSRLALVEGSWENFVAHPLFGIGFGLPSRPEMLEIAAIGGIPVGAPREKGFLPSAVLEECGVIGGIAFLAFLIALSRNVTASQRVALSILFWTSFFTTLGEMTFFSPGGVGLYVWLLMSCASVSAKRYQQIQGSWMLEKVRS